MPRKKQSSEQDQLSSPTHSQEAIFQSLSKYFQGDDDDTTANERYTVDTGNLGLNYIISGSLRGGYSSGLVTELFGDPSTGKTLLMMVAAANIQKEGGIVVVADVERRWDWDFAKVHGVNPGAVLKHSPETVEQWSIETDEILDEIMGKEPDKKILFILDSIGSLSTYWEMENVGVKEDQGKKAKRLKAAMRVIPKKLSKANAILLASNHVIENPQQQYGPKGYAPGGKGFPFQSSIRLELIRPLPITPEGKSRPIGATLRIKCAKNSICPPFGEVDVNITWSGGMQRFSGLVDMMLDLDIIHQPSQGWYQYKDGRKFRAGEVEKVITEYPEILEDPLWKKNYFTS